MTDLAISPTPGSEMRRAFAAAAAHLRETAPAVDAINVYPVPDGDTGSNMSATLSQAVDETLPLPPGATPREVLQSLARGALYGARGNSGVILSQALRGFADGCAPGPLFDASSLAAALTAAAAMAYRAVSKPAEGTMLTVLRRAAEEAAAAAAALPGGGAGQSPVDLLRIAVRAAEEAEALTMEQLPALREAGVPDAGGEGICVIFRGFEAALTGSAPRPPSLPERPIAMLAGHEQGFGFCTEFVLEAVGTPLNLEHLRALITRPETSSIVVVGDETASRIHVHTPDPDSLLASVQGVGQVSRVKVDDMTAQSVAFEESGSGATARVGLLALSHGAGMDEVFRGLGASVADLGVVIKPPAGDIAAAADALRKPDVIVLPNHKNVVSAARQAVDLAKCTLHVIPTESLPQGIAAAFAYNAAASLAENAATMDEAYRTVRTVEVTIAAADRTADGVDARAGEAIVLVDGELRASLPSTIDALVTGLELAGAAEAGLIALYTGDAPGTDREAALKAIEARFPGVEVETVHGGQPLYPFIASVES